MLRKHFRWQAWEQWIRAAGLTIDRPLLAAHPVWKEIVYPMNYGFVNGTTASDGEGVDIFVGTEPLGLVGLIVTYDVRKGDREVKLLYDCAPGEIYTAQGFLNFDQTRMAGFLVLRQPMHTLWDALGVRATEVPP